LHTQFHTYAIPEVLTPYAGAILDLDSHEQTPVNHWVDQFGSVAARIAEAATQTTWEFAKETRVADDAEITPQSVWQEKRSYAPGSFDFRRRLSVLDLTGIDRQLIFPGSIGLLSVMLFSMKGDNRTMLPTIDTDRQLYARQLIDAYNDWALRTARSSPRLRPVAILVGEGLDDLLRETRKLLDAGASALWMPSSTPPGGLSPADTRLDPLWAMIAAAGVPLTAHIGADYQFLKTEVWKAAEAFQGFKMGDEFSLDPYTLCTTSWATENFLMTMVLGGVFERHPHLRYYIAEVCADWLGPLMRKMDMWIENSGIFHERNVARSMKMKPSEYVHRNVRVGPFDFENIGEYISKYSEYGLEDIIVYGSDFPHREGGKDPMGNFSRSLLGHGLGEATFRKFFVENAKLILPD